MHCYDDNMYVYKYTNFVSFLLTTGMRTIGVITKLDLGPML